MSGGQHRVDEVTRTEPVGWDRENNSRIEAQRWPEKQPGCTTVGACAKGINKEVNILDEADFVRDVENRAYHLEMR
jgi:hypothetical protein